MICEFCPRDCEHLSVTEDEQIAAMKRGIHKHHWCTKYDYRLYHLTVHPMLYKCDQCKKESTAVPLEKLEEKIVKLECKLNNTLELLKTVVRMDRDFDNETTDYFIEELSKLQ